MANVDSVAPIVDQHRQSFADDAKARRVLLVDSGGFNDGDVVCELGYNASDDLIRLKLLSQTIRTTGAGTSGTTTLTVVDGSSFSDGDEIGIYDTSTLGNFESNTISSGGGTNTLIVGTNLANTYSGAQVIRLDKNEPVTDSSVSDYTESRYQRFGT